ncbi:MAG: hypothetical protein MUO31_13275 [Thermodesulfovibrionales bacterium]|nr:hypothetical protein [Thermodesulfovibrionales bacterium]
MSKNMYHLSCIEGLVQTAVTRLMEIKPRYPLEATAKEEALDEFNAIQTGSLHNLRILLEGDPK